MPPTLSSSGSTTVTLNTASTLYNPTGTQYYSAYVDLSNMASGDTTTITVSVIDVTSGSTYIQYYSSTWSGAQTNPLVYIPPLPSDVGWKLVIEQTAGTARAYQWRVYQS